MYAYNFQSCGGPNEKKIFNPITERCIKDNSSARKRIQGYYEQQRINTQGKNLNVKKVKDLNAPRRAKTGYNLFYQARYPQLREQRPDVAIGEAGRIIGAEWTSLSETQKDIWRQRAAPELQRYRNEAAMYRQGLKKPMNGRNLYFRTHSQQVRAENRNFTPKQVFSELAHEWNGLNPEEKDLYRQSSLKLQSTASAPAFISAKSLSQSAPRSHKYIPLPPPPIAEPLHLSAVPEVEEFESKYGDSFEPQYESEQAPIEEFVPSYSLGPSYRTRSKTSKTNKSRAQGRYSRRSYEGDY